MMLDSLFRVILPVLLTCCYGTTLAQPRPSALFGDYAVLPQGVAIPVWGEAPPGEWVTVRFATVSARSQSDAQGRWRVLLPPLEAGLTGELVCESASGHSVSREIISGDVWLCSGQSNMEWPVKKTDNAEEQIAAADIPAVRHFKVLPGTADRPQNELKGKWSIAHPENAGSFSALGFYMARALYESTGVPQGVVNASWGGTSIEAWMSLDALQSSPELEEPMRRWEAASLAYPETSKRYRERLADWEKRKTEAAQAGLPFSERSPAKPDGEPGSRRMPTSLYNAMIHPLIAYPYRAIIWYQGEANWRYPERYAGQLCALIEDWRDKSGFDPLPFVIMQLPGYGKNKDGSFTWPILREAQAQAAELPQVSLVVSIDLGNVEDIHPTNKEAFAERLVRVLKHEVLGCPVPAQGPRIVEVKAEAGRMLVELDRVEGIVLKQSPAEVGAFELAGTDGRFFPAEAVLQDGAIRVFCAQVPEPVHLRYAWRPSPISILYSEEGLPAAPYRTDRMP